MKELVEGYCSFFYDKIYYTAIIYWYNVEEIIVHEKLIRIGSLNKLYTMEEDDEYKKCKNLRSRQIFT
jgi:hypothetical protein